jgi:hypothetical protein
MKLNQTAAGKGLRAASISSTATEEFDAAGELCVFSRGILLFYFKFDLVTTILTGFFLAFFIFSSRNTVQQSTEIALLVWRWDSCQYSDWATGWTTGVHLPAGA